MNMKKILSILYFSLLILGVAVSQESTEIFTLKENGVNLEIEFKKGESHNHPSMAFWIEDMDGNFVKSIYVTKAIGTSIFRYGDTKEGEWIPSSVRRPAALPYWGHKRGIKAEDGLYVPSVTTAVADAITAATPSTDFKIYANADVNGLTKFRIMLEINQTWDWNYYWTNNKYPDDEEYKTSAQPALVYEVIIDLEDENSDFRMKLIGHSHHSGQTGELFNNLETITTAEKIIDKVIVRFK